MICGSLCQTTLSYSTMFFTRSMGRGKVTYSTMFLTRSMGRGKMMVEFFSAEICPRV